jgi:DNA-binding CsgD family transcriptional regulator
LDRGLAVGGPHDFAERIRRAREALSAEIGNGHYALYERLRLLVSEITVVDAFFVALFRDERHVLYVYHYDGKLYSPPGTRDLDPRGPTGWVYAHKRPYTYSLDGGRVLNRGINWGDTARRSADALFVPMRRTNSGEIIGVVSAQTYIPDSYDAAIVEAVQFMADLLAHILSGEDVQRQMIRSLGYPARLKTAAEPGITESIIERVDQVRRLAENTADLLESAGREEYAAVRKIAAECERVQIEAAELELEYYRDAAYRFSTLSRREQEVARLLAEDMTNDEIAGRLSIARQTVKTHIGSILKKYGARQRSTVVEQMRRYHGYLD